MDICLVKKGEKNKSLSQSHRERKGHMSIPRKYNISTTDALDRLPSQFRLLKVSQYLYLVE